MSDQAASRHGPPIRPGGKAAAPATGPGAGAHRDPDPTRRLEVLIRSLPERFREAGEKLALELFGAPGSVRVVPAGTAEERQPPWHSGLRLEEAWAIAQTFRRFVQEAGEVEELDHEARIALGEAIDRTLLNAATENLERTSRAHRRMIQDVSHDLRSPLNSVLFLADALRTERSGPLNEAQAHQLDVLYTAAETLVRMANDLIDFARLGSGRERITVVESSFSLETVIEEVRNLVGPLSTHRGVKVISRLEAEGLRRGDQRLLTRILLNLVSNAIEAADSGGTVTVDFSDTDTGHLCVEVGDDRAGTDIEKLRDLLAITDDRWPGETRGWTRGLGLTISARFVDAAGGRLDVRGREGTGTVFRVELPFPGL